MYGTVVAVDGDVVTLETAPGVTSRWLKPAIAKLVEPPVVDDPRTRTRRTRTTRTTSRRRGYEDELDGRRGRRDEDADEDVDRRAATGTTGDDESDDGPRLPPLTATPTPAPRLTRRPRGADTSTRED